MPTQPLKTAMLSKSVSRLGWALLLLLPPLHGLAQERIYRCGNEYTNHPGDAAARGCRLMEGGNLTVIQNARPASAPASTPAAPAGGARAAGARNGAERVGAAEQRARDSDARAILETELRRAEARLDELLSEFNAGEPVPRPDEAGQPQRYRERVERLRADVARAESDVEGIRRELARALSTPRAR
jgi:hypothetical protein